MDSRLELEFFGGCRVSLGGRAVDVPFAKSRALLCYLVLNRGPHPREMLAELLWGEFAEEDARTSLRARLSGLRRLLPNYFRSNRDSIAFNHDLPFELDVIQFQDFVKFPEDSMKLLEAIELYQGDFLEGFHIPDAPTFEAWLISTREQLREEALEVLQKLVADSLEKEDLVFAHRNLLQLLELDPWREESHRQMMLVLALQGQREAAIAQYLVCCRVLAGELGLEPSLEATELFEKIRAGELQPRRKTLTKVQIQSEVAPERRQLTVLSGALAGIDAYLDPEELLEITHVFHREAQKAVDAFGGSLVFKQNTSFTAYFGYPASYEDAPRRAVYAAAALVGALGALPSALQVKLGVHTGWVVITGSQSEPGVVGLAPTLARALHESARPGEIIISDAVRALVKGYFDLEGRGSRSLEEISEAVEVYNVKGATRAQGRLQATPPKTAMVGRTREIGRLHSAWQQACAGQGCAVLVSGEAGIGKSRLLHTFEEEIAGVPVRWLDLQCSPYQVSSPFRPVIDLLERELGFDMARSDEEKLQILETSLRSIGQAPEAVMPSLAAFLLLPAPNHAADSRYSPERQRSLVLDALLLWLTSRPDGAEGATVLTFEDLHWADPSTLELVEKLAAASASLPLLLLATARPDFKPATSLQAHMEAFFLSSLSPAESKFVIRQLTSETQFPQALVEQLTVKGDGVPLYIEELTKEVLETSWQSVKHDLQVPRTLQDILTARLDRLARIKPVAQLAAVIGKSFSLELLSAVHGGPESTLVEALEQLSGASLIFRSENGSDYRFNHALIRDAAYGSLLKSQARTHHARVARVLEGDASRGSKYQPEVLAQHFAAAGLPGQAIHYWREAASRASERSAQQEAIYHLRAAIEVLDLLPDTAEQKLLRIALLLALGNALHVVRGYAVPEVEAIFGEARDLCQGAEASEELFEALYGLAGFYAMRARYDAAETLMLKLFEFPRPFLTPRRLVDLHFMESRLKAFQGELFDAVNHAQMVSAVSVSSGETDSQIVRAIDFVQSRSLGFISAVLWLRGYPEQALKSVNKDVAFASRSSDLRAQASALAFALIVAHFRHDIHLIKLYLPKFMHLASDQILTSWLAYGLVWQGAQQAASGRAEGLATVRHGLDIFDSSGAATHKPYLLGVYASAQQALGKLEAATETISLAITQAETTGELWWRAELYRLKGEFLIALGDYDRARSYLYEAFSIAAAQGAKSLELRSAISLLQTSSKKEREKSLHILGKTYKWFTEAFEDKDLRDARITLKV